MADQGMECIEGQICRIRGLSKRLVFYDMLLSRPPAPVSPEAPRGGSTAAVAAAAAAAAPPAAAASPTAAALPPSAPPPAAAPPPGTSDPPERWVEVVVKSTEFDDVQGARDAMRIGDAVRFRGEWQDDAETMLTCRGFEVLAAWRDVAGGRAFVPRAIPRHTHYGGGAAGKAKAGAPLPQQQQQTEAEAAAQPDGGSAAAPGQKAAGPPPVCKFYINSGRCLKGADCPFLHVDAAARGQALADWIKKRCGSR
jgi:hypothetical protein